MYILASLFKASHVIFLVTSHPLCLRETFTTENANGMLAANEDGKC